MSAPVPFRTLRDRDETAARVGEEFVQLVSDTLTKAVLSIVLDAAPCQPDSVTAELREGNTNIVLNALIQDCLRETYRMGRVSGAVMAQIKMGAIN